MANKPVKKTSQEDWHPADILAALHKRGITFRELARRRGIVNTTGYSRATISPAYPGYERDIAEALELHPMDIWPSRYNADGSRKLFGLRAMKSTQSRCHCNGKEQLAA